MLGLCGCQSSESQRKEMAPAVCNFLTTEFANLDSDNSGTIDKAELLAALAHAEERQKEGDHNAAAKVVILRHIIDNLDRVGHVTGSHVEHYTDVTYIIISTDPLTMVPIYTDAERTVNHYGINQQDITAYRNNANTP